MENINTCPVCFSTNNNVLFKCIDKVSSGETFEISICNNCTFQFTSTRPKENEAGTYYQSDKYVSHTDDKKGIILSLYRAVRNINLKWKLEVLNTLSNKGHILDYGCGLGTFLHKCKENGWKTTGMDISADAREVVKKRYDIDVLENKELFSDNNHEKFNIITLWHVLEHVYNLDETVEALVKSTQKGGHILFALPNHNSYDAQKYKEHWDAYDVPRHIWHFNKKSIEILLKKHGMQLVQTKPMVYDSYYVSIRSEMHKGSKLYFLKGMFWGLISHIKALQTKEYSSQLYIFKK